MYQGSARRECAGDETLVSLDACNLRKNGRTRSRVEYVCDRLLERACECIKDALVDENTLCRHTNLSTLDPYESIINQIVTLEREEKLKA